MIILGEGILISAPLFIGTVTALCGAIAYMFKLVLASHKREVKVLEDDKNRLESIADEGISSALDTANQLLRKEGLPLVIPLAKVVPEGASPSTPRTREDARLATKRAIMAQIKLAMKQEPRKEPT